MSPPSFEERWDEVEAAKKALSDDARADTLARQRKRGKMTARERIDALLDPGSFSEQGALVTPPNGDRDDAPGDGMWTGIGRIDGRPVAVASQDFSVYGGSVGPYSSAKIQRLMDQCLAQGIPLIMMLDGGGHRIQGMQDSWHFANTKPFFADMARLSGWVPVVAAIMGDGFAAPTNFAAFAELVIMVRDMATMGLSGPALVKVATGEEISKEELGGAEVQVDENGLAHMGADSEADALGMIRQYLSYLPSNARGTPPQGLQDDPPGRCCNTLTSIVPTDSKRPYDVRKVIREIADADSLFEIQPTWGGSAITAFARMNGRSVGFIANQPMRLGGMLTSQSCEKIARFIAVCDAFGLPLIYLIDVPGFSIGPPAERAMLGRRSGKLIAELAHATVPRLSLVLRKGYGGAYVAMCGGKGFAPDAAMIWPTAEICPMSIEGSVDVAYRREYEAAPDPSARRQELIDEMREQINPLRAAGGMGIDDIIHPADTRRVFNEVLSRAPERRHLAMPPKYRSITPI